jgi:hypothetical protein
LRRIGLGSGVESLWNGIAWNGVQRLNYIKGIKAWDTVPGIDLGPFPAFFTAGIKMFIARSNEAVP